MPWVVISLQIEGRSFEVKNLDNQSTVVETVAHWKPTLHPSTDIFKRIFETRKRKQSRRQCSLLLNAK